MLLIRETRPPCYAIDTGAPCKNQAIIPNQKLVLDLKAIELKLNSRQQFQSDLEN